VVLTLDTFLKLLLLIMELQRNRVDTMPFIRGSVESLAFEYMSKMSAAGRANNLSTDTPKGSIFMSAHGAWYGIKKRRPAAAAIEFGSALVKGCPTACAGIDTFGCVFIVLASARALSPFLSQYSKLFGR